jgi:hypothetical protein
LDNLKAPASAGAFLLSGICCPDFCFWARSGEAQRSSLCALADPRDHAARLALHAIESYGRPSEQVSEARPWPVAWTKHRAMGGNAMRRLLLIVGLLALAIGLLWIGQGLGVINWPQSSFMIRQMQWAGYGAALAALGLILIWQSKR